jgi:hypothetical protein
MESRTFAFTIVFAIVSAWCSLAAAQMDSPRDAAPVDVTGYWVSVVTEDWRWRMMTPPKGDYASVPLTDEGRRVADTWDPERDEGTCRPYGAAGLMRMPMRIRIEWDDDNTLRIETDHGRQTRYFHFDSDEARSSVRSLQGDSVAEWDGRSLKVTTTNMTAGYLRRNGVPYSEDAVLLEYFDRHAAYDEEWITVTAIVTDPVYLTDEFITSSSFKQLPDGSSWNPVACENR